jgi:hypothetical protein
MALFALPGTTQAVLVGLLLALIGGAALALIQHGKRVERSRQEAADAQQAAADRKAAADVAYDVRALPDDDVARQLQRWTRPGVRDV